MTPLHVDALWEQAPEAAPVPEYFRAVPTGPLAPLVLAVTTAGAMLDIGITFRLAAYQRGEIDRMAASLVDRIAGLPR